MEVILLERVEKLGQMGEVVTVKDGYARNFLLPQGKALRATADNRRTFEDKRAQHETANEERRGEAEKIVGKLDGLSIVLVRQAGEGGQLYGSVKARDIAGQINAAGFAVERRQVLLDNPIKAVGLYTVRIGLHPEVAVMVTANVARSDEEARIQAETGRAVIHQEEAPPEEEAEEAPAAEAASPDEKPKKARKGKRGEEAEKKESPGEPASGGGEAAPGDAPQPEEPADAPAEDSAKSEPPGPDA